MINEKDKQDILNGEYGITRNGFKIKYLFTSEINKKNCRHLFLVYREVNGKVSEHFVIWLTEDFKFLLVDREHDFDVVGLWKDKTEPFDLERALDGELVKYSDKPCYVYQSKVTGLYWVEAQDGSFVDDCTSLEAVSEQGMWKEPEPVSNTVAVTLPRALKEPQDEMWYVDSVGPSQSTYGEEIPSDVFEGTPYFRSRDDANAWFQAMKDSRP